MAAWQDSLVLSMAIHHLQGASDSVRRSFVERYERLLFPHPGTSTAQTKWRSIQGITRVTLWGRDHFRNNIRLAMVLEAMNLGPRYYCVMSLLRESVLVGTVHSFGQDIPLSPFRSSS